MMHSLGKILGQKQLVHLVTTVVYKELNGKDRRVTKFIRIFMK
jgi:hypothetical protein